jgi:hypothetical protein
MPSIFLRFVKRLVVLIPGLAIAYLSVFTIYPWLDNHLPIAAAIFITYILAAYVLIPGLIRLLRILFPPKHLPLYSVTPDGFASDPLNIGIIGTRQELITAMTAAGWHEADPITLRSIVRTILSTVYGLTYNTVPMSHLYLFGRTQDLGFQMAITDGAAGSRHHVRFWAATYQDGERLSVRSIHWQNRQAHVRDDRLLWVGAASRDIGITFIRHNAQLTHIVDPNTDEERELIAEQLQRTHLAQLDKTIKLGEPYKLANIRGLGRRALHTDGRMTIMKINPETARQARDS